MRTYDEYLRLVEESLISTLKSVGEIPEPLMDAMSYSLTAGGKRLRPVLLLAAFEAMGGHLVDALPFACAIEMIHTYSLIHDDLPAMDNDALRRGKPTNHVVFGEGLAILSGDGLFHAAMELMLRSSIQLMDRRGLCAAEAIARRSGVTGMIGGQVMDVTGEGTAPTMDKVAYIHQHKTADLIIAAVEAGMLLAGADAHTVQQGIAYGQHLGLAFQMVDDLLDVVGDASVMGKNAGMDATEEKLTWIAMRGIEGTRADAAKEINAAIRCASVFGEGEKFFADLAKTTQNRVQ